MKSRWRGQRAEGGGHSPVEMRFIDMFMTAIGSLVFVAIVLIVILPKMIATEKKKEDFQQQKTEDKKEDKKEERKEDKREDKKDDQRETRTEDRREDKKQDYTKTQDKNRTEDIYILRRWINAQMIVQGCGDVVFELYVRSDGSLIDMTTFAPKTGDEQYAKPFDAGAPWRKTILYGEKYTEVGGGLLSGGGTPGRSGDVKILQFSGVSRNNEQRYVYLSVSAPDKLGNRECVIYPIFQTWLGSVRGRAVTITRSRPFAWLRKFKFGAEGQPTIHEAPEKDEQFLKDLGEFSRTQSEKLCQNRSLCGTEDAHLYALRLAGIAVPSWPVAPTFERFPDRAYRWKPGGLPSDSAASVEECEKRCDASASCLRYTYFKYSSDPALSAISQRCRLMEGLDQALIDDVRADSGERATIKGRAFRIEKIPGAEFWGKAYVEINGGGFDECSRTCLEDTRCEALEWDRKKVQCRLFDSVPGTKQRGTIDIGIKKSSS